MNYEQELNDKQYEAVTTSYPHVRIIAGAGSGKTRVLTYRISYLISEEYVKPWRILAITFTNKAAGEMKARALRLVPEAAKDLSIRTFHSFANFFLRQEIKVLNFPTSFTILDEEDQTKMVKDIASQMGFKKSDKIVGKALSYIGSCKLKEKYPEDIKIVNQAFEDEKTCLEIYERYEEQKNASYNLDFDDLLLKTNYILENFPDIRSKWQSKYNHILVDEFQDTNDTEFKLIKLLSRPDTYWYMVGDPDQTIYTWRGANQDIILNLNKYHPDTIDIVLNQNYRSTQNILDSANKLISHNKMRVPKDLFTKQGKGEPVVVKSSISSRGEADYVAREIIRLKQVFHYNYSDIVLLYRSNYITLDFESALMAKGIPYRIYGGQKFYQRREIKDVLAYFHLIVNPKDDVSFERIMNVPKRGIGDTTVNTLKEEAAEHHMGMYEYVLGVDADDSAVQGRALNALKAMIMVIENTKTEMEKNEEIYSKLLEEMINAFNYKDYLLKEDDGDERIENVKALFQDIRHFLQTNPESTFDEYLQNVSLLSAQDDMTDSDAVTLMTVHTAKGLEYPVVFVVRFNDAVFPNMRATLESGYKGMEEERRLAYVAITRARERLYLTYCNDFSYVVGSSLTPSPFLKESGNEPIAPQRQEYNPNRSENRVSSYHFDDGPHYDGGFDLPGKSGPIRQDFSQESNDVDDWKVGDHVIHKTLGNGQVIELEGDGIIKVRFESGAVKSLMGNHPSLKKGGIDA